MLTNFRLALRMLAKRPGLSAGRVLTVTVVVAAISSVFTVANATFLRPLPFPDADRLLRVYLQPPGTTDFRDVNPLDPFEFVRFRGRTRNLDRFEGIWAVDRAVIGEAEPDTIRAGRVSAGFLSLLGATPSIGRFFTEAEVDAGDRLVVLSDGFWQRRFGGDPAVLGRTLSIDREPHTVIGVTRPGLEPAFTATEFWTPLTIAQGAPPMLLNAIQSVARLHPGATFEQATTELESLLQPMKQEAPALLNGWTIGLVQLREAQYGSRRPAILMLLAAVAALGLIAVANLANLTLADAMSRLDDFAVRAALGASRRDLAAPELMLCVIVATAGGVLGLAGASWLVPAMVALDPSSRLASEQLSADWRVVVCAFGAALAIMLAAVAAPVLRVAGPTLASSVAAGARRAVGGGVAHRARIALVTAQTALAIVLLSSGAMVVTSMNEAARTSPGFEPANVVSAQLKLSANVLPRDVDRAEFVDQVIERLKETPGIVDAGTTLNPFTVNNSFQTLVHVEDRPSPDGQPYTVQFRRVTPGYFGTMRIRLVRGRLFDRHDVVNAQPVVIVSESFARRFWSGEDPIGRRIKRGATAKAWSVVVGVVADVRDVGLDQPLRDTVYAAFFQGSNAAAPVGLVVRTSGDPAGSIAAIQRAVWAIDPKQPLGNITTLEDFMRASLGPHRFRAMLVAACGVIGLFLATIGTYGVTARSVIERRREVGIRMALGGRAFDVCWSVAKTTLRAVLTGAVVGVAASSVAGVLLRAMLPELERAGWAFSGGAAGVLLLIGAAATLTAARRATSVDPLIALR